MNSLTIFRCTVVATVLSAATLLVSGCIAPLVIGGAAVTTTTVMTDRRTRSLKNVLRMMYLRR